MKSTVNTVTHQQVVTTEVTVVSVEVSIEEAKALVDFLGMFCLQDVADLAEKRWERPSSAHEMHKNSAYLYLALVKGLDDAAKVEKGRLDIQRTVV